jgi:hypothetical protein
VLRAAGIAPAAAAIFATMVAYAGFLFSTALHLQAGLGYGPLRAGMMFVPGAAAFAIGSLNWRRVPARWHRLMIPVALLVAAAGFLGLGWAARNGSHLGAVECAFVVIGIGFGSAFSPLMTVAVTHVAPADAADASGLLATMTQLGQVVGVATMGSLFLALLPDPASSPHATLLTDLTIAGVAVAAAGCAAAVRR